MVQDHYTLSSSFPAWLIKIIRCFHEQKFQCYVVGGAVRDLLRKSVVYDYDLATDATPQDMKRVWKRAVSTGEKYGTMTLLSGQHHTEVTTFRSDGQSTDSRHPDSVKFATDITTDLSRRDFTINAIAYDPLADRLIDPFGGIHDIKRNVIRTVGVPTQRFDEDALRILRAVRFATTLNFAIEPKTEQAMVACADTVRAISNERIREELERIIVSPHCVAGFACLARLRLLPIIFEIKDIPTHLENTEAPHTLNPLVMRYLEMATNVNTGHQQDEKNKKQSASVPRTASTKRESSLSMAQSEGVQYHPSISRHVLLWYALVQCYVGEEHTRVLHVKDKFDHILARIKLQLATLRYSRAHQVGVEHLIQMIARLPTADCTDGAVRYFFFEVGAQYMHDIQQLIRTLARGGALVPGGELAQNDSNTKRLISLAQQQRLFSYRDLSINGRDLQKIGYKEGLAIGAFLKYAVRYACDYPDRNTRAHLTEQARIFLASDALLRSSTTAD